MGGRRRVVVDLLPRLGLFAPFPVPWRGGGGPVSVARWLIRAAGPVLTKQFTMSTFRTTDLDIEAAAIARFGCHAAHSFSYMPHRGAWDADGEPRYALAIQRTADAEAEVIGVRVSRAELLRMVEKRTAQESTRPASANLGASCGCQSWRLT